MKILELDDKDTNRSNNNLNIFTIVLSGIFLGLAIFTKLPVFLMIPVIAYLVYTNIVIIIVIKLQKNKGSRIMVYSCYFDTNDLACICNINWSL